MSVNEIERVKQDIATIKQAAGLELPFGWESVWATMFVMPAMGAWWLVCGLFFDIQSPYVLLYLVPMVFPLAVFGHIRWKYRRPHNKSSAILRRANRSSIYASIVLVVPLAVFLTWAMRAGADMIYIASGVATILGMMIALTAFHCQAWRSNLGGGIVAIVFGISVAIWPNAIFINACIALLVAGPATAFIMMYQLKQAGQRNDAH